MAHVIAFPSRPLPQGRPSLESAHGGCRLPVGDGTFCATLLLEGMDNPRRALEKAARLVRGLPEGRARDLAAGELERLRFHLGIASSALTADAADISP